MIKCYKKKKQTFYSSRTRKKYRKNNMINETHKYAQNISIPNINNQLCCVVWVLTSSPLTFILKSLFNYIIIIYHTKKKKIYYTHLLFNTRNQRNNYSSNRIIGIRNLKCWILGFIPVGLSEVSKLILRTKLGYESPNFQILFFAIANSEG